MSRRWAPFGLLAILTLNLIITACSTARSDKVCVVLDTGGENDKSFNEFTLKGARDAARDLDLIFDHIVTSTNEDYAPYIANFVEDECGLIITVGFLIAQATADAARTNPNVRFAIIDVSYSPGSFGCPADVVSCYSEEGGLSNITSLVFAEDQVGYLAGTMAGCMTETNVVGSVAGMEIPPVVAFVTGYQNGARSVNPEVETLNVYIPEFSDAYMGKQEGDKQIAQGADVIFGVGGNAGNGGVLAAHDVGRMAIGVDVDQYFTFPEVRSSLLTSAMKNVDVAAGQAVRDFAAGQLAGETRRFSVADRGVGLAPYHDWDERIPGECKAQVEEAINGLSDGSISTGS